jgi:hypothetical protein
MHTPCVHYRLTFAKMGVYAHVAGSTSEALALPVGDVLACLWVDVLLGQAKVCMQAGMSQKTVLPSGPLRYMCTQTLHMSYQ